MRHNWGQLTVYPVEDVEDAVASLMFSYRPVEGAVKVEEAGDLRLPLPESFNYRDASSRISLAVKGGKTGLLCHRVVTDACASKLESAHRPSRRCC